jgi:hypothetical protein
LSNIFYSSPEKQFEYLQRVVGIEVDERIEILFNKWKEYKATRDLIVHNHGIINEVYLFKADKNARGSIGDSVVITDEYIDTLVAESKSLIGSITTSLQRQNKV